MIFAKVDSQKQKAFRTEMKTAKNAIRYRRLKVIALSARGYSCAICRF